MKSFLIILLILIGGFVYFLSSEPEDTELEDFLVQDDVIFEEFIEEKTLDTETPIGKKMQEVGSRKIAEVVKKEKEEEEMTLELIEAINRQKFGGSLTGSSVSGSINLFENQIQSLSINLKLNTGPSIIFEADNIEINPGGSFVVDMDEGIISGILIDMGKGKYTLRFATGKLAGSALKFEREKSFEEKMAQERSQIFQAQALAQREEVEEMNRLPSHADSRMNAEIETEEVMPMENEDMDTEMDLASHDASYSDYDMEEKAENSGYTF